MIFGLLGGGLLLALMIWNLIWLHRYGQTIGKRIVKIRIVRSNGESWAWAASWGFGSS